MKIRWGIYIVRTK